MLRQAWHPSYTHQLHLYTYASTIVFGEPSYTFLYIVVVQCGDASFDFSVAFLRMDASNVWEEIVLIRSALLPHEFQWHGTVSENEAWERAYVAYEAGKAASLPVPLHVSLCVNKPLGVWMNTQLGANNVIPSVIVERTDIVSQAQLADLVRHRLSECETEEIPFPTFDILNLLQETVAECEDDCVQNVQHAVRTEDRDAYTLTVAMKRVIFWSHHLVAPSKRRQFAAWCPELNVWGVFKLGYPGFLCFEGASNDIDEMVRRVKSMQWAAISMRIEVPWTFTRPQSCAEPTHDAALRACKLAHLRDDVEKLRTDVRELESMSAFVAWYVGATNDSLREMNLDEDEVADACHLRTSQGSGKNSSGAG